MILTSTTDPIAFVAPWRAEDRDAPKFWLRAGSVIERGMMEAELAGQHRAGVVAGYEMRLAATSGIEALLAEDPEKDRVLELFEQELQHEIDKLSAKAKGQPEPADPLAADDRRILGEVRQILAEHWPEYRELVTQMERRRAIAPIIALKRFCVNIEGAGVVFAMGADGQVSEKTLAALDPQEMALAGSRAFNLQYAQGEEKNSARPSPSDDSPKPTASAEPSKAGGRSKAHSGRKTLE